MDKIDTLVSAAAAAVSVVAAIAPDDTTRVLAFNALGAVMGGYVGASIKLDEPTVSRPVQARRWLTNFAAAITFGPLLTDVAVAQFPEFSPLYLAIASGGFVGVAGVALICILFPMILQKLEKKSKLP